MLSIIILKIEDTMPVLVQNDLPAIETLEKEGLFVMSTNRSKAQDIRPLKIALVNLMPTKIATEVQFIRLLSNSPLQIELTLLHMGTHISKNTSDNHLKQFYKTLKEAESTRFDGMIITGAPVENMEFSDVDYWGELTELMEYTKSNVYSTMYICWGAQAGLYYHYGISKKALPQKCFGIFPHHKNSDNDLLLKGTNDIVSVPHSRHSEWDNDAIRAKKELKVVLESEETGICMISAGNARQIFISGHFEYDSETLAQEYYRDINKGLDISIPQNYFVENNPHKSPTAMWCSDANLLFANWLNYVIYQSTPFDLDELTSL